VLLFDGTIGDWKTKLVSFQLKEGVSPYHGQAFPVPKIHKDTIMKEVERMCKLGVLERQPASEWALPSFIIPKKDRTIHLLSDFCRVEDRFGIFGRYSVGISWYLPNQYRRKTWSVHFGIIFLEGTPFFFKGGVMAPFLRGPAPILRKKGFPAKP
jgi:hypothetical protein